MDIFTNLLIVAHLFGVVLCVGTAFSVVRARPALTEAAYDERSVLFQVGRGLGENGMIGLAILWTTGPLLLWVNFPEGGIFNAWLVVKIAVVIALTVCIFMTSSAGQRLHGGDMSVAPALKRYGRINLVFGLAVMVMSVVAFN